MTHASPTLSAPSLYKRGLHAAGLFVRQQPFGTLGALIILLIGFSGIFAGISEAGILPGILLVGIYMAYILIAALIRPSLAPAVKYDGKLLERSFLLKVALALVPPLLLIFLVLGSIIAGIATVNQAGAIGAVGALIMAGYKLHEGSKSAFYPSILTIISLLLIWLFKSNFNLSIKTVTDPSEA